MKRALNLGLACVAALLVARTGLAGTWAYTFNSTSWTTTLPLTNLPPDSGPAGFSTTFTASPVEDSFQVNRWNGPAIITDNSLLFNPKYITGTPAGNLTLTFSASVSAVSLVIESAGGISGVTVTNENGESQYYTFNAVDVGGIPVIQLNFAPTNSFSTMTLQFAPTGSGITFFNVGNIVITPTPPPPLPALTTQVSNGSLVLTWPSDLFALQSSTQMNGNFTDVPDATSPCTNSLSGPQMFFHLRPR